MSDVPTEMPEAYLKPIRVKRGHMEWTLLSQLDDDYPDGGDNWWMLSLGDGLCDLLAEWERTPICHFDTTREGVIALSCKFIAEQLRNLATVVESADGR